MASHELMLGSLAETEKVMEILQFFLECCLLSGLQLGFCATTLERGFDTCRFRGDAFPRMDGKIVQGGRILGPARLRQFHLLVAAVADALLEGRQMKTPRSEIAQCP